MQRTLEASRHAHNFYATFSRLLLLDAPRALAEPNQQKEIKSKPACFHGQVLR
jgi:hypothetical protein